MVIFRRAYWTESGSFMAFGYSLIILSLFCEGFKVTICFFDGLELYGGRNTDSLGGRGGRCYFGSSYGRGLSKMFCLEESSKKPEISPSASITI